MTEQELLSGYGNMVKKIFCKLFGEAPSPKVLSSITGIQESEWLSDYPYVRSGELRTEQNSSLCSNLFESDVEKKCFVDLTPTPGFFFESLHYAASGKELDAVASLLKLSGKLQFGGDPASINALTLLSIRSLLKLHLTIDDDEEVSQYLHLCLQLFPLLVACGCKIPFPATIFFRARGLARINRKHKLSAFFELMIGATNMCNHSGHGCLKYHKLMEHGRNELLSSADPEDLLKAMPYFGIYHFMEGNYQDAFQEFQLASLQMRRDGQIMMELFCLRHWCFSAFNLGMFEYSEHQLQSRLREFSPRSDNQLARTIRGQLAGCFLRTGKLDNALEHLDIAQLGTSPHDDIVSWISNSRQLAYYHALRGNIEHAYHVFRSAMEEAYLQNYNRPLYLSCVLLELLYLFESKGFDPIPCYDLKSELNICLHGPNRLLKGIANRILGDQQSAIGNHEKSFHYYKVSLKLLHDVSMLEESKTHIRIALLHYKMKDIQNASIHALYAWPQHDNLKHFWPDILESIIPPYIRESGKGISKANIISQYDEQLSAIPSSADWSTFLMNMLISSCHILGASDGFLFIMENEGTEVQLVASAGTGKHKGNKKISNEILDLMRLVKDGNPQIFDSFSEQHDTDGKGRMMVLIPFEVDRMGTYVLCHDYLTDPNIRYILDTNLLEKIGEVIGKSISNEMGKSHGLSVTTHQTKKKFEYAELIAASASIKEVLIKADAVADTSAAVMITGESGVGKELIAKRIHEHSGRAGKMVSLNLAGLSDELLANELFGHERGAFTGAQNSKPGLIEVAKNGTLFLDEISEASIKVQVSLLRVLETHQFYRVGGTQPLSVDFRLICASNRSMKQAVSEGLFRNDLYYRISSVPIKIPPLRERPDDITALAFYYLHFFANLHRRPSVAKFSAENMRKLLSYSWPGNIRELKNVVEQSVIFTGGRIIDIPDHDLGKDKKVMQSHEHNEQHIGIVADFPSMEEVEKRYISMIMNVTGGRINGEKGALSILKMNRSTLYSRLKEYGLK